MRFITNISILYLSMLNMMFVSSKPLGETANVCNQCTINNYQNQSTSVVPQEESDIEVFVNQEIIDVPNRLQMLAEESKLSESIEVQNFINKYLSKSPCKKYEAYCTDEENMIDEESLKKILRVPGVKNKLDLFLTDTSEVQLSNRFGLETFEPLCLSRPDVSFSLWIKTTDSEEHERVLTDEKNKKGIKLDKCDNPGGQCNHAGTIFAKRYETECKQMYTREVVLIYNKKATTYENLYRESVGILPSCCKCEIKEIANVK